MPEVDYKAHLNRKIRKKRPFVKYLRDFIKSVYPKGKECYICGTTDRLEFHHYNSMSILARNYLHSKNLSDAQIKTEGEAFFLRQELALTHINELFLEAVTLCKRCHEHLHSAYGKTPMQGTKDKQKRWVGLQRDKRLSNGQVK